MPWTTTYYPDSFKNLEPAVRDKAVDIANALLEEGYTEGRAIPIAISQAKKWAAGSTDKDPDQAYHVMPHPEGWAIRRSGGDRAALVVPDKIAARDQAIALAKSENVDVVVYDEDGQVEDHISLLSDTQRTVERAIQDDDPSTQQ